MKPLEAYEWLKNHSLEMSYLGSMGSVVAWDQRTYLPPKGHAHRAQQLAALAKLLHGMATDSRIAERLEEVEGTDLVLGEGSAEAANVREWRRMYDRTVKIPSSLAEKMALATSECETLWEQTRAENDWKKFSPKLKEVMDLTKEKAAAVGYEEEVYDALLEDYEPGETTRSIEPLFDELKASLTDLLRRIETSPVKPKREILERNFDVSTQAEFGKTVVSAIGYDFKGGRLDKTAHPFTIGIGPGDVRITTRYAENFFPGALFGSIHEAGHALYEQGLPRDHWGTPTGETASLGVHESQSRLWENMVARRKGFWRYFYPIAGPVFPSFGDVDLDTFVLAVNAVRPSLIRVEADEITYNLHILVRFELELKTMRGDVGVDDLPDAWRDAMKTYLGVEPEDMASGAMQDVHWSAGLFGYFPTYTLGNLYAAQLYTAAEKELGNLEEQFALGEFKGLLGWLRKNIHQKGGLLRPKDLIKEATGESPSPKHFIDYCEKKYAELYKL